MLPNLDPDPPESVRQRLNGLSSAKLFVKTEPRILIQDFIVEKPMCTLFLPRYLIPLCVICGHFPPADIPEEKSLKH